MAQGCWAAAQCGPLRKELGLCVVHVQPADCIAVVVMMFMVAALRLLAVVMMTGGAVADAGEGGHASEAHREGTAQRTKLPEGAAVGLSRVGGR